MELLNYNIKDILNIPEFEKLFRHFFVLTGLDVKLYDAKGFEVLSNKAENCICSLARDAIKCRESIVYGGKKARELGEPYIFACGCGLIMCSSPVVFNNTLIGSIVCGPVMLWEADDYAAAELSRNISLMGAGNIDLKNIKQLSCVNMTSAAQVLYTLVNYICGEQLKNLEQKIEIAKQKVAIIGAAESEKTLNEKEKGYYAGYPAQLEKKLIAFVQLGEKNKAKEIINNYLGGIFFYANGDLEIIKAKLYEFSAFLSRAAVEAGAPLSDLLGSMKESSRLLSENIEYQDLCSITIKILYDFIDIVYRNRGKKQSSGHLLNAVAYINSHFSEDITLDSLSKNIFVSAYYLSHLFRDEMNTTFSDYINEVRIEEAKRLLKREKGSIEAISEKTGFKTPGYFTKIFKKITGISPAKYRNLNNG